MDKLRNIVAVSKDLPAIVRKVNEIIDHLNKIHPDGVMHMKQAPPTDWSKEDEDNDYRRGNR